jgi:hypothetical protein
MLPAPENASSIRAFGLQVDLHVYWQSSAGTQDLEAETL